MIRGNSRSCANWRAVSRIMRSSSESWSSNNRGSSHRNGACVARAGAESSFGLGAGMAFMGAAPRLDASLSLNGELDALRQRQGRAVVEGVRGPAHVALPGTRAGLAATARLLLASEGAADLGAGRADVHVGDAAIGPRDGDEGFGLAHVAGEDRGGQACADPVVQADRLMEVAVADDVEDRGEGLPQHGAGLLGHLDQGGADVEGAVAAGAGHAAAAVDRS